MRAGAGGAGCSSGCRRGAAATGSKAQQQQQQQRRRPPPSPPSSPPGSRSRGSPTCSTPAGTRARPAPRPGGRRSRGAAALAAALEAARALVLLLPPRSFPGSRCWRCRPCSSPATSRQLLLFLSQLRCRRRGRLISRSDFGRKRERE